MACREEREFAQQRIRWCGRENAFGRQASNRCCASGRIGSTKQEYRLTDVYQRHSDTLKSVIQTVAGLNVVLKGDAQLRSVYGPVGWRNRVSLPVEQREGASRAASPQ